jgi:hypothetical protein
MNVSLIAGYGLLLLGGAALVTAAFRSMGHNWSLGVYEFWVLPVVGLGLLLLGSLLVR